MDGLDCCYADVFIDNHYDLEYKILDYKTIPFKKETYNLIKKSIGSYDEDFLHDCSDKLGYVFLEKKILV